MTRHKRRPNEYLAKELESPLSMIAPTGTTFVPQEESIGFQILRSIRRIIRRTSEHSRSVSRHGGITVPQMLCLKAISEFNQDEAVTVAMVAKTVQLSSPYGLSNPRSTRKGRLHSSRASENRSPQSLRHLNRSRLAAHRQSAQAIA